jgi:hypothetical protein
MKIGEPSVNKVGCKIVNDSAGARLEAPRCELKLGDTLPL